MSERELPYARTKRELRETRHALAVAREELQALRRDAAERETVTQRIALSAGMATVTHPATMTARDVERLSALVALLETPQPLDRVQEPASHADGQHGCDEG